MADWYVSSAAYATVPVWAATTAYTVGQFVRPTAPTDVRGNLVYRCTTAGTSAATEPTWGAGNNNNVTVSSGTAVFTCVGGQSAYGWSAAAGTLYAIGGQSINARCSIGDRVFVSSDHTETWTSGAITPTLNLSNSVQGFGQIQIISVNRAGSVPPVAVDERSGAVVTNNVTAPMILEAYVDYYWQGISFIQTIASQSIYFNNSGDKTNYFKNCALALTGAGASSRFTANDPCKVVLDNTTLQFSHIGQSLAGGTSYAQEVIWLNTPSALVGSIFPTTLFSVGSSGIYQCPTFTCRGVDLSVLTGTLVGVQAGSSGFCKVLLDSCRIAAGVARLGTPTNTSPNNDEIELVNCFDGTSILNERYTIAGSVVTDRNTYLNSGGADDIGNYSFKMVSNIRSDKSVMPLDSFWLDIENALIGAAKTATVEIISATSLNNDDITLLLEYMGTGAAFTTWNAADLSNIALTNNNLTATATNAAGGQVRSPFTLAAGGKYYWECTVNIGSANSSVGFCLSTCAFSPGFAFQAGTAGIVANNGSIYINGAYQFIALGGPAANQVIGFAVDRAANLMWIRYAPSGNWNGSGTANPATGVGGFNISSVATGSLLPAFFAYNNTESCIANFGASAFSGAVPSGFTSGLLVPASSVASFASSLPSVLTTPTALPTSGSAWTSAISYIAWNPVDLVNVTLSNNNLTATPTNTGGVRANFSYSAGKVYWEFTFVSGNAFPTMAGMGLSSVNLFTNGSGTSTGVVGLTRTGAVTINNVNPGPNLGTRSDGDVISVAIDITAKLAWFRVAPSGNWNGSGTANPATGVGGVDITPISTGPLYPLTGTNGAGVITANFGASAFIGAVPSGFSAGLQNTPTIKQQLQANFTPQRAGRIRGLVRLGKTGSTVWVNPQIGTSAPVVPFVTWDPATITAVTLSGGNLIATNIGTTSVDQGARVANVNAKTSGKYYFEATWTTIVGSANFGIGVGTTTSTYTSMGNGGTTGVHHYRSGTTWSNGSQILGTTGNWSAGQIAGIAVDLDNRRFWFRASPSGNWNNSGTANPATNTGGLTIPAGTMVPFVTFGGTGGVANNALTANFGTSTFSGAVPSGFLAGWPQ